MKTHGFDVESDRGLSLWRERMRLEDKLESVYREERQAMNGGLLSVAVGVAVTFVVLWFVGGGL